MPDGYVTGSGGMLYFNQTLFLYGRVGSGHETTYWHSRDRNGEEGKMLWSLSRTMGTNPLIRCILIRIHAFES